MQFSYAISVITSDNRRPLIILNYTISAMRKPQSLKHRSGRVSVSVVGVGQ